MWLVWYLVPYKIHLIIACLHALNVRPGCGKSTLRVAVSRARQLLGVSGRRAVGASASEFILSFAEA